VLQQLKFQLRKTCGNLYATGSPIRKLQVAHYLVHNLHYLSQTLHRISWKLNYSYFKTNPINDQTQWFQLQDGFELTWTMLVSTRSVVCLINLNPSKLKTVHKCSCGCPFTQTIRLAYFMALLIDQTWYHIFLMYTPYINI